MIRLTCHVVGVLCVGLTLGLTSGCDYSRGRTNAKPTGTYSPGPLSLPGLVKDHSRNKSQRDSGDKALILSSSIELIKGAALKPGGGNFKMATQQLNQFFEGTSRSEYLLDPRARAYLAGQLPNQNMISELEKPEWDPRTDARHLEDCMMYSVIAGRVGGTGDDLDRVTRVFNWIMQQIQLVPAGTLGTRQLPHVPARPYDLLLRGMATEAGGLWAERSWLFMSLCRQLGIDVGILTYSKGNVVEPLVKTYGTEGAVSSLPSLVKTTKPTIPWICGALIHDQVYLFDARVGLPVPGPHGQGVATLEQVLSDPSLLERMDLPGQEPYETSQASLLASLSKIGVLLDSSPEYFSPKMRLLQRELAGKDRTILFRDPAEQRDHFARALGDRLGEVKLWQVPLYVRHELFTNAQFVQAAMQSMVLLGPEYPLVYARIKQLRGDFSQAIEDYISFRLAQKVPLANSKKKDQFVSKDVQQALDAYATNYLALAQMERNNLEQARDMFLMLLDLLPEPGPQQPYYNMLRWGAHANLGRIYEAMGDRRLAIAHYTQTDPTMQHIGNLLRAREIVWEDPMAAPPEPLPPAPAPAPAAPPVKAAAK